jgi:hypothetical protein
MSKTIYSKINIEHGVPKEVKDRVIAALKDRAIDFSDCPRLSAKQFAKHTQTIPMSVPSMDVFENAL